MAFRGGVDGGATPFLGSGKVWVLVKALGDEGRMGDEPGTLQRSSSEVRRFNLVGAGFGPACVLGITRGDEAGTFQISPSSRPRCGACPAGLSTTCLPVPFPSSLPASDAPLTGPLSVFRSFEFVAFVAGSLPMFCTGRSPSKSESSKASSSESGTSPDSLQFFMISDVGVHKGRSL